MKKKVKSGSDDAECVLSHALESSFDRVTRPSSLAESSEAHTSHFSRINVARKESLLGLTKRSMKHNRSVPCTPNSNLTISLKISKNSHLNAEEDCGDATSAYKWESRKADHSKIYDVLVGSTQPTCKKERRTADLTSVNTYLHRNKVCQNHFSTSKVVVGDDEQRFCQQWNGFHMSEFDEDRRSCRHDLARKRSQPEATSVLSWGTLVYLPGKSHKAEKNARLVNALFSEDAERTITNEDTTERTVTNEETSGMENTLKDDASSLNVQKQRKGGSCNLVLERSRNVVQEDLDKAELRREEPESHAIPAAKKDGGKRRANVGNLNVCQVEGCMFDLSTTKEYFRRRKVCEGHFKASKVLVKNLEQRFCQQCSRFHVLAEFDEGRKSCKRMLMGHNMRRRKAQMSNLNSTSQV